jgi:hypothetical protein
MISCEIIFAAAGWWDQTTWIGQFRLRLLIAGGIGVALALLMTRPPRRSRPPWR